MQDIALHTVVVGLIALIAGLAGYAIWLCGYHPHLILAVLAGAAAIVSREEAQAEDRNLRDGLPRRNHLMGRINHPEWILPVLVWLLPAIAVTGLWLKQ